MSYETQAALDRPIKAVRTTPSQGYNRIFLPEYKFNLVSATLQDDVFYFSFNSWSKFALQYTHIITTDSGSLVDFSLSATWQNNEDDLTLLKYIPITRALTHIPESGIPEQAPSNNILHSYAVDGDGTYTGVLIDDKNYLTGCRAVKLTWETDANGEGHWHKIARVL